MNELAVALSFCTTLTYILAALLVISLVVFVVSELKN